MSGEVEIGHGKHARRAYSLDDIALLPARCTCDPKDMNVGWQIDAYHVDIPVMAVPMDSVVSPQTTIDFDRLDGIGVLNLNGLWARYKDPESILEEISHLSEEESIVRLQQIYPEPIRPRLIIERLAQVRGTGVVVTDELSPQLTQKYWRYVVDAGVDLSVIRGPTVSMEHVSSRHEPLNLKRSIYEFDVPVIMGGVCTGTAALHLMRTGVMGVLVSFGRGVAHSTRQPLGVHAPMMAAIADIAAARRDYVDKSGGRYAHVTTDGGIGHSRDLACATVCGADTVMFSAALARAKETPGRGWYWGSEMTHSDMPRRQRVYVGTSETLEQTLYGPSTGADGLLNFVGTLKRTMVSTGYAEAKDLQKVEAVVSPY